MLFQSIVNFTNVFVYITENRYTRL